MRTISRLRQLVDEILKRLYEARKVFLEPPGLLYRLRLYWTYRRIARGWQRDFNLRIQDVLSARDNENIPRVPNAGEIVAGELVMHNGLRISPGSYVDERMTRLLQKNRAVHEPQEEVAFAAVISWLQNDHRTDHTMIEVGSYWAFYSLWFKTALTNSKCFCVEPDKTNLNWGRKNFELNSQVGDFTHAYIGSAPSEGDPPTISIDSFISSKGINHVDVLHSDIQGYELEMLRGARETFSRQIIDYVFISTHSHYFHYRCLEKLAEYDFRILADADLLESHSLDGLILAVSNRVDRPPDVRIHHRTPK